ncbi:PREDICTED: zinc finger protein ZAT4-like [Camelina sativa]|uniref:Zinc finger protein ZAT4-like n=1 Tax=Camelina sativa TaxID=90675 RepID=A0ABM0YZ87_CAMSA|nr:PREDICTED: zinc finger protein ZAT4-like [Camelina sativa]
MERYKCRFCFKSFVNGRALGGHMRSHMLTLSEKPQLYELISCEQQQEEERPSQLSDDDTESDDASSSSDHLKRNRSSTHDDGLEFDFAEDDDDDVESETESSKINNPTRRRSKRTRKLGSFDFDDFKKLETEHHNHSSASDTTTEEDLAFCLIMLSRDKWKQHNKKKKTTKTRVEEEEGDETDHECEDYKSSKNRGGGGGRGRFKCETCGKEFKSYQALGGHRASHKKNKLACTTKTEQAKTEYVHGVGVITEKRVHECPICFRVFTSGQALGGHKRSHGSSIGTGRLNVNRIVRIHNEEEVTMKQGTIDLNLPAPNEEDETSLVFDEW